MFLVSSGFVESVILITETRRSTSKSSCFSLSIASYASWTTCDEISVIWWTPLTRRFTISAMFTALKIAAPMPLTKMVSCFVLPSAPVRRAMAYVMYERWLRFAVTLISFSAVAAFSAGAAVNLRR
jgi:hypothetical protein